MVESGTGDSLGGNHGSLVAPDLLAIGIWALVAGWLAIERVNFNGDGLRHIAPILAGSHPSLGEARWLLFPAVLFAAIKPLQNIGLVDSVEQAAHVFVALDLLAGLAYLFLLRRWLIARSIKPTARAAALFFASMCRPLLEYPSNTVEPIIAAAVALAGVVYLASQPSERKERALAVAAIALCLATLIYQGMLLAIALVPCALGDRLRLRRQSIAIFFLLLAAAPLTMFSAIVMSGHPPRAALHQMLTGEANDLYKAEMKSRTRTVWPYFAAVTVGPAENIIPIPDNRGLSGAVRLVVDRAATGEGLLELTGIVFSFALLLVGAGIVARNRDWRIAVAFCGILILPLLRSFQYSYTKFYVLMPAIVALVFSTVTPFLVLVAGAVVGVFNTVYIGRDIIAEGRLASDINPLFGMVDPDSCYLTTSWSAPTMKWPGSTCSLNSILSNDSADQPTAIAQFNRQALIGSLRRCFCGSPLVLTDDLIAANSDSLAEFSSIYGLPRGAMNVILWQPDRGTVFFDHDDLRVFAYSKPAQAAICANLKTLAPGQ